ncbi:hemolysin family protein [Rhodococcus sp. X156]|uniref:hemolysin family protein n=1 Tax=Rhodococcus sp. X156 TaxID=2499145 RepID=UPI000FDB6B58|nr:hemolysin family protein [Rhodococcus sp. X156]
MNILLPILGLIGFLALTAGTAVFVAAEFSLTALERSTVDDAAASHGDRRAKQVQHAHRTLSFQLSGAQLGITITTLVTGYIAEPVLAGLFSKPLTAMGAGEPLADGISLALALLIATSVSMVFGELVPKNLAIDRPLTVARATAGLQAGFSAVFKWVINLLNDTANRVVRMFGVEPADELRSARSPQELGSLVRTSARHGSLNAGTANLLDRSLRFGERNADELMTPRVRIDTLNADDTVDDLLAAARATGHSRFPVVNGDLDDPLGVVHVKQAFTIPDDRRHDTPLERIVRRVATVPATLDGDALMDRLRGDGMQVAFVVDEYGGTAGMVTMEDLIEEIVGDVRDEHDPTERDVQATERGWELSGLLRIDEVAEATDFDPPEGEYETIGGLVLAELGRIPEEGDVVRVDGWQVEVRRMDGMRVDVVDLVRPSAARTDSDSERSENA